MKTVIFAAGATAAWLAPIAVRRGVQAWKSHLDRTEPAIQNPDSL